jgi:hypothetical protein
VETFGRPSGRLSASHEGICSTDCVLYAGNNTILSIEWSEWLLEVQLTLGLIGGDKVSVIADVRYNRVRRYSRKYTIGYTANTNKKHRNTQCDYMHFFILGFFFIGLLSLFWKNKSRLMWSPCCVSVNPLPPSTYECLNQSLRNLVCISWHLRPVQWRTSQVPPISLCVYMCIPLSTLGNGSVKTLLRQRIHTQQHKNCWTRRFLCGPCRIKGK